MLKLYTTPRLHKSRKGTKYAELQDAFGAESSRYAVLSVTNPNYSEAETLTDGAFSGFEDHHDTINNPDSDSCLVKMPYNEDKLCNSGIMLNPRNEERPNGNRFHGVYDRLTLDAVPVKDVLGGPIPAPV